MAACALGPHLLPCAASSRLNNVTGLSTDTGGGCNLKAGKGDGAEHLYGMRIEIVTAPRIDASAFYSS